MAEITDYLTINNGKSAQQNISIATARRQEYVDALEYLKGQSPRTSVSAIMVDAVIQRAAVVRAENERGE